MESSKVPQDQISTHANVRKAIYATGADGGYEIVPSSGWLVEEEATRQAVEELERLADEAYAEVLAGKMAPLYFHMYNRRMDISILAQAMGIFKWRLKRHLQPKGFARLSSAMKARYSQVLGLKPAELEQLPARQA